jgi:two-component system sensor histidine kinase CreC
VTQRNRVFLVVLLVYLLAVLFLLQRFVGEIDPRYRESAEDTMVETANLVASLVQTHVHDGALDVEPLRPVFRDLYGRTINARIYTVDKVRAEMRVLVYDARGWVRFDSAGLLEGKNYSLWRDVVLTLEGKYGARTTEEVPGRPETAVMYVSAPIWWQDRIVGVVSVGRSVASFAAYRENSRQRLVATAATSAAAFFVLLVLLSLWIVTPQGMITEYVRFARAQPRLRPGRLLARLRTLLRTAYSEIRDAITGREYVTEYVQALTHELKSPLSAIRGAAELLQEPMPEPERARFAANVARESQRIQTLIERMLELASLERRRGLEHVEPLAVRALVADAVQAARAERRRGDVSIEVEDGPDAQIEGDRLLLTGALVNLLDNALDFSPPEASVSVSWRVERKRVAIVVRDRGPGVPEYARDRLFERFYSLTRPRTGRKGTGLGLTFVREVAELHDGDVGLAWPSDEDSTAAPGTEATLRLPRADE